MLQGIITRVLLQMLLALPSLAWLQSLNVTIDVFTFVLLVFGHLHSGLGTFFVGFIKWSSSLGRKKFVEIIFHSSLKFNVFKIICFKNNLCFICSEL